MSEPIVPLAIAWRTRFRWGWDADRRRRRGWRRLRWRPILESWVGTRTQVLEEAYKLEGHPDNVAACWLGGFVAAVCEGTKVHVARSRIRRKSGERLSRFRQSRFPPAKRARCCQRAIPLEDVVANLQSVAVLGLAFAQGASRFAAPGHERSHSSALSRGPSVRCCLSCCRW